MIRSAAILLALVTGAALASDQAPAPARIRIAGIFMAGFNVWKVDGPRCTVPTGKPWLKLECGFIKCPKPKSLGIPLELDYTNWRANPRWTEMEIEADKPLGLFLSGNFARGGGGQVLVAPCVFDARFTPRAGAMYEASVDPTEQAMFGADVSGFCRLRLTEIRASDTGIHERMPVEGADIRACIS
jgi:hypothetical protein